MKPKVVGKHACYKKKNIFIESADDEYYYVLAIDVGKLDNEFMEDMMYIDRHTCAGKIRKADKNIEIKGHPSNKSL